jgi:hypothetical protein
VVPERARAPHRFRRKARRWGGVAPPFRAEPPRMIPRLSTLGLKIGETIAENPSMRLAAAGARRRTGT